MNMNTLSSKAVNKFIRNSFKRNGLTEPRYYNDFWDVCYSKSKTGFSRRRVFKLWPFCNENVDRLNKVLEELKEVGLEGWELYVETDSACDWKKTKCCGIKKYERNTKVRKYNIRQVEYPY